MTRQTFPCGRLNAVYGTARFTSVRILKAAFQIRDVRTFLPLFRRPIPGSFNFGRRSSPAYQPVGYPFLTQDDLHTRHSGHPGMIHTGHAAVILGAEDVPLSGRSAPSIDIISRCYPCLPSGCGPFLPYHVPFPHTHIFHGQQRTGIEGGNGTLNPSLVASVPRA